MAESSDTESDRLPATRMNGRTRTISRLPLPRVVVDTRMTWRAALASPGGGSRSVLRAEFVTPFGDAGRHRAQCGFYPLGHGRKVALAIEGCENGAAHQGRAAKTRQDGAAEPLDRYAVAVDQSLDSRRRPTSGGSLPRSMCSASKLERNAPRRLPWSKPDVPSAPRAVHRTTPQVPNATEDDWR